MLLLIVNPYSEEKCTIRVEHISKVWKRADNLTCIRMSNGEMIISDKPASEIVNYMNAEIQNRPDAEIRNLLHSISDNIHRLSRKLSDLSLKQDTKVIVAPVVEAPLQVKEYYKPIPSPTPREFSPDTQQTTLYRPLCPKCFCNTGVKAGNQLNCVNCGHTF